MKERIQTKDPLSGDSMKLQHAPIAKAEMLIRRPPGEVFEAFVDPAITSRFWFTKSSGRLETGKQIRWDWEMYDVSCASSGKSDRREKANTH
jgi:hypothetical protein